MSCEGRAWLTNQPGVSSCTHVFVSGFGRPQVRSRVKEARPLYFCLCDFERGDDDAQDGVVRNWWMCIDFRVGFCRHDNLGLQTSDFRFERVYANDVQGGWIDERTRLWRMD